MEDYSRFVNTGFVKLLVTTGEREREGPGWSTSHQEWSNIFNVTWATGRKDFQRWCVGVWPVLIQACGIHYGTLQWRVQFIDPLVFHDSFDSHSSRLPKNLALWWHKSGQRSVFKDGWKWQQKHLFSLGASRLSWWISWFWIRILSITCRESVTKPYSVGRYFLGLKIRTCFEPWLLVFGLSGGSFEISPNHCMIIPSLCCIAAILFVWYWPARCSSHRLSRCQVFCNAAWPSDILRLCKAFFLETDQRNNGGRVFCFAPWNLAECDWRVS